jgi:hypothetical protein
LRNEFRHKLYANVTQMLRKLYANVRRKLYGPPPSAHKASTQQWESFSRVARVGVRTPWQRF